MAKTRGKTGAEAKTGKLRIGDMWNAITIIASSQTNPLKAIAEFVENAIGLLSFWTVGEEPTLTSSGGDGKTWEMRMKKGDPGYAVRRRRTLIPVPGTELRVGPLLPGLRLVTGEKIQWHLASELRDRIRSTGVDVRVIDRRARKEFKVEPRQFSGRFLRDLPEARTPAGDVYLEIYLSAHDPRNGVGLYRSGTRVLESLAALERFDREPWTSGYFEGIVDSPFLHLTPGTRGGVIRDEAFTRFAEAMEPVEDRLQALVAEQREAEEEQASRRILKAVQKALREALAALPPDEYDWFDIRTGRRRGRESGGGARIEEEEGADREAAGPAGEDPGGGGEEEDEPQRSFFEFAGPLFSARVLPGSCVMPVNAEKKFRASPRDRQRRLVERDLAYKWRIAEGEGLVIDDTEGTVIFVAPHEPGLTRLEVTVTQGETACKGEALVTVTDSLPQAPKGAADAKRGLPGYTYRRAPAGKTAFNPPSPPDRNDRAGETSRSAPPLQGHPTRRGRPEEQLWRVDCRYGHPTRRGGPEGHPQNRKVYSILTLAS